MKTIFSTFVVLAATFPQLSAQDQPAKPPAGFIRVVNAVAAGTGNVNLLINGEDMRPSGYLLGDATGGIGLRAGSQKVTIQKEGVQEGSTTVNLGKDQTVTLIPFSEQIPATDQEPAHHVIRMLRLRQKEVESGRTATFVSVSATPELKVEVESETGKRTAVFVKRLMVAETPLNYSQGYAPVLVNGSPIKSIPIGGAGNYVVVLYDDAEGKVQSLYFRDFKFLSAD
jgi:hypothetical protein